MCHNEPVLSNSLVDLVVWLKICAASVVSFVWPKRVLKQDSIHCTKFKVQLNVLIFYLMKHKSPDMRCHPSFIFQKVGALEISLL